MSKIAWASSSGVFLFSFSFWELDVRRSGQGRRLTTQRRRRIFFGGGHIKIMVSPALSGTCGIWVFFIIFFLFLRDKVEMEIACFGIDGILIPNFRNSKQSLKKEREKRTRF